MRRSPRSTRRKTIHQDDAALHPESRYIATFDLPNIAYLNKMFAAQYREQPVQVAKRRPNRASRRTGKFGDPPE